MTPPIQKRVVRGSLTAPCYRATTIVRASTTACDVWDPAGENTAHREMLDVR
jgi:hypothetical protein